MIVMIKNIKQWKIFEEGVEMECNLLIKSLSLAKNKRSDIF
jgi:hypothetical protein